MSSCYVHSSVDAGHRRRVSRYWRPTGNRNVLLIILERIGDPIWAAMARSSCTRPISTNSRPKAAAMTPASPAPVPALPKWTKNRVNESNVEVGAVAINTLRTGAYNFNFTIVDSVDNSNYTARKKLFVYNPELPMDTLTSGISGSVLGSEYATMTESELDLEFAEVRYIANHAELSQYNNVKGVDAKRKVLFDFWRRRENESAEPGNVQKAEYFKRVDYANEHFKSGYKDGWKTDRGRVFIVYGPPDDVERHANEINMKPYKTWTYHSIQGGVEFDFGDRSGLGDYILLNSTHRDELHNESWMQQLQLQ